MSDRSLWTRKYDATEEPGPKYGNKPKRCSEGIMHQSKLEAARCTELHLMQRGGLILELEAHPQPRIDLTVNGVHIAAIIPDFKYCDQETGRVVYEDTKGFRTREWVLKSRLALALHGVEIQEVRRVRGQR